MLIIFLVICIVIDIIWWINRDDIEEEFTVLFGVINTVVINTVVFIAILVCSIIVSIDATTYKNTVNYITTENEILENKLYDIVLEYKDYEQDTFKNLTPENASTYIIVNYPELKSNTLVDSYIQTLVENKKELQRIELEHIHTATTRWWLYFGK